VRPERAGTFAFHCDVFCGDGHEEMSGRIVVTPGSHRIMIAVKSIWHAPGGKYAYLQFGLDAIEYNVSAP
jgi:hypothetical protein